MTIYIREAHPADSPRAREGWSTVNDPITYAERIKVATQCAEELDLGMPFAIDDMDDSVARAYDAYPDRIYIVGADGRIAYQGGRGPSGFKVDEMTAKLANIIKKKP